MPIHLETLTDLAQLVAVLDLEKLSARTGVPLHYMPTDRIGQVSIGVDLTADDAERARAAFATVQAENARALAARAAAADLAAASAGTAAEPEPNASESVGGLPDRDANGLPWDDRIHSTPAKLKADGAWRARRGVSDELVAEVTAELLAAPAEDTTGVDPAGVDLVATETHALPQSAPTDSDAGAALSEPDPEAPVPSNLLDLLELAKASAGDASDSLQDLLARARDFTNEQGVPVFQQLKSVAAPAEDGRAGGKGLQLCTPGERRLLRACLDNYHLFV